MFLRLVGPHTVQPPGAALVNRRKESLGGNALTTMMAALSPAKTNCAWAAAGAEDLQLELGIS